MRATTPPVSQRIRTPPAPLHGPAYDSYEPYSPRRSSRVASLRQDNDAAVPTPQSSSRKKPLLRASSSLTLSPPASPESFPITHHETPARSEPVRRSLFTRERPTPGASTNTFTQLPTPQTMLPTPQTMLPTPSETPSKRDMAAIKSTARILNFKPALVDDVMPTPSRKRNKSRMIFEDDAEIHDDFKVYTDVQDRVPEVSNTEDNPFVGPRKPRVKTNKTNKTVSPEEADMYERVARNEGMIYTFRGKKMFRPYVDVHPQESDQPESSSNALLRRQAGISAARPLTKTALKGRLLWPAATRNAPEEDTLVSSHEADDEEALTDIEEDNMPRSASASFQATETPAKKLHFHPATPPSSHRQTRSAAKKLAAFASPIAEIDEPGVPASPSATPMPQVKARDVSPFADWQRVKNDEVPHSVRHGKKRARSSGDNIPPKRTRSTVTDATIH